MKPVAYMVLGLPHYRQPFLDESEAQAVAALHGGIVKPLVYEEEAQMVLRTAAEIACRVQRQAVE